MVSAWGHTPAGGDKEGDYTGYAGPRKPQKDQKDVKDPKDVLSVV